MRTNAAMDYSKVAHLYDVYVKTDIDVPFFLKEAKGCERVLELMAGTGRVSIPLIEAGIDLTCVDNSGDMLRILRQKLENRGLTARVHEMDVCSLSLPEKYDLILLPFHSFSEIVNPADQREALRRIRTHLAEAGRFICTLHNPAIRLKSVSGGKGHLGEYLLPDDAGTLVLSVRETFHAATHIVSGKQFYEIYDSRGTIRSRDAIDIRFRLHDRKEFDALLRSEGFSLQTLYGDYTHSEFTPDTSPFMIFILGKM